MKHFLWLFILIPLVCYGADSKITDLPDVGASSDDVMYVVDNPGLSTASDNKITLGNLLLFFATQDMTLTGTIDASGATVSGLNATGLKLADASTITPPAAAPATSTYNRIMGCNDDGTCDWISATDKCTLSFNSDTFECINQAALYALIQPQLFDADGDGTFEGGEEISDEQLICGNVNSGLYTLKSCGAKTIYTEPAGTLKAICDTGTNTTGACDPTAHPGGFSSVEIGHATDTTLGRTSAGVINVEGVDVALKTHTAQYSATPVIDDPDNFATNFTGDNLYGGTFIANAAGTAALPEPAVGMNFTYVLEGANANIIDPLGTGTADTIVMNGLAAAADENITSSTRGAMCVFQYRAANSWMATCNGFAEATPP